MTEPERCNWKADKVETRYTKCLSRSTTRLSNVLSGSTQEEDEHCAEQFSRSMDVLERRASFWDVGSECLARISEDGQNAAQAEALVAAGRDLADYPDLGVDDRGFADRGLPRPELRRGIRHGIRRGLRRRRSLGGCRVERSVRLRSGRRYMGERCLHPGFELQLFHRGNLRAASK